ncbi:MAG TPA: AtpZ/AtpI family protein [Candidatus Microsaccharimonas sp.]|nr:AtpZ/AtpI family protein [Candidatus Microsaccharimonas sp.]
MKTPAVQATSHATPPAAMSEQSARGRSAFVSLALDMSWQLAVVVLVPMIAGALLDKKFNTSPTFVLIGLAIAVLGSVAVMWRTLQTANSLPVPKLSAAQKRAVQKQYEEDDKDA